jgi:outer membrane immunogenic protein
MKKLVLSGLAAALAAAAHSAAAADFPVAPVYRSEPVVVIFNWTGFYAGIHGGGGFGTTNEAPLPFIFPGAVISPAPVGVDIRGGLVGGQFGANYQVGSVVFGGEAQGSWANLSGSTNCASTVTPLGGPPAVISGSCSTRMNGLGTIAGRWGIAQDRLLGYAKGGAAWASDSYGITTPSAVFPLTFNAKEVKWGWMVGAGVEYAFNDFWSVKAEYNYMDFGSRGLRFTSDLGAQMDVNISQRLNVVKFGINYRLGVQSVVVKY